VGATHLPHLPLLVILNVVKYLVFLPGILPSFVKSLSRARHGRIKGDLSYLIVLYELKFRRIMGVIIKAWVLELHVFHIYLQ
jgi:hypothetical protein